MRHRRLRILKTNVQRFELGINKFNEPSTVLAVQRPMDLLISYCEFSASTAVISDFRRDRICMNTRGIIVRVDGLDARNETRRMNISTEYKWEKTDPSFRWLSLIQNSCPQGASVLSIASGMSPEPQKRGNKGIRKRGNESRTCVFLI